MSRPYGFEIVEEEDGDIRFEWSNEPLDYIVLSREQTEALIAKLQQCLAH